jgi:hypothetical protein
MELYLVSTVGLGDFYIVEKCPTSAAAKLGELLSKSDHGISDKRIVTNIKILGKELYNFPENKPNFSSGYTLILPTSCV